MEKIQTHVLPNFRETITRSTIPSEQQSRQTLTEFDDVYTSAVSPGPSSPIGLVWLSNRQNTANNSTALLMMVSAVTVGIPAEFQPATPEPWTTASLGANDSVVTGHAWAHSVPHSSRRDTGENDGFTAWQIRIRSLDRRCGCWPLFRSNCTDASTRTPWVKYRPTLAREKNCSLAEKWSGFNRTNLTVGYAPAYRRTWRIQAYIQLLVLSTTTWLGLI